MSVLFSGLFLAVLFSVLAAVLILAEKVMGDYGPCRIDINGGRRVLEVDGGRSLLAVLIEHGIYIPSACGGKGSCGYCKVRIREGGGVVLPTERPFLERRELRAGMRLACQVKVREDLALELPVEYLDVQLFEAVVERVRALTHDIKEITLALEEPGEIEARPGQYVQVEIPAPGGVEYRAYSISSPSWRERHRVELAVRLVPGGVGSGYLHCLGAGDRVRFTGPYGEFVLREEPEVEIVCIGGGAGMAPIKNIVYSLYARQPGRRCRLFFGCRTFRDVFYYGAFRALAAEHPGFRVVYSLSEPPGPGEPWDGEIGFVHLAVEKYLPADGTPRQAFLCGPPPMIEAATAVLLAKGLAPADIFYDRF